ncbi:OmpP1/FadL family transporter [Sphingobacterium spiritivorum]|uniref:Outer membrane protein NMB0088 n=1 Tax=Sphingobacterium spiritivorum TaxID=258 RepID=A0A380BAH9_SPHSI|nr:outer membrane protein transport protein [Sphingobacterium spiritivorum]SUI98152.1 Putative outer membrane protein NMB0088 precursor [Sphingobacterium spiritivorum]
MKKLLFALLCASPSLLWAQGSQVNLQSPKSVGMGGAGSAYFIDEASIFYSPGALAKMDHNAVMVAGNAVMYKSAFRESGSSVVNHTKSQISPPFSLFAAFGPKNSWWKAGIGVYTPYGGGVDWGTEWAGRFSLVSLSLRAIYIQPTLSFKLTDNFSIGGGFVYNIGSVDLENSVPVFFPDGRPGLATLKGTGSGTGYNVGVHYNLEDDFAISLSYRSKVVTKLKDGDALFDVPESVRSSFPAGNTFTSELPLPSTFALGIAFPLSEKVKVAVDGTLIGYSIYKELNFDYKENTAALQDTRSAKNYVNAGSVKAGLEYLASEKLQLRVGGGYMATPVQANYVYPETPDNTRYLISGGFTFHPSKKFDVTGSFAYQRIMPREANNVESHLSGTYKTNIFAPGVSVSYKW